MKTLLDIDPPNEGTLPEAQAPGMQFGDIGDVADREDFLSWVNTSLVMA